MQHFGRTLKIIEFCKFIKSLFTVKTALDSKISDINNMLFFKLVGLVAQSTLFAGF